eukprot:1010981-Pleurochrysis_carterae.AAC.1
MTAKPAHSSGMASHAERASGAGLAFDSNVHASAAGLNSAGFNFKAESIHPKVNAEVLPKPPPAQLPSANVQAAYGQA